MDISVNFRFHVQVFIHTGGNFDLIERIEFASYIHVSLLCWITWGWTNLTVTKMFTLKKILIYDITLFSGVFVLKKTFSRIFFIFYYVCWPSNTYPARNKWDLYVMRRSSNLIIRKNIRFLFVNGDSSIDAYL